MAEPATLIEMYSQSVRRHAQRPLFGTKAGGEWSWTSYADFDRQVLACRGGLAALGVRAGDRVAVVANNRVEWAVAAYATYGLGAAFVPMYESQRLEDWSFILRDSAAKVVFSATRDIDAALDANRKELPALTSVIGLDLASGSLPVVHGAAPSRRRHPHQASRRPA